MTVYNVFWKIIKKNAGLILMYIAIFLGITIMIVKTNSNTKAGEYKNENINVAVIDHDNSELSKSLTAVVESKTKPHSIVDTKEGRADALFYRIVEYIVIIPEGYEEDYLGDKKMSLEKMEVTDSYSGVYVDNIINSYLDSIDTLRNNMSDTSFSELIKIADKNASQGVEVSFASKNIKEKNLISSYYNYSCYGIMASVILGVGIVINAFIEKNIKQRNAVSPVSTVKLYRKISLCTVGFVIGIWVICEVAGIVIVGRDALTFKGALMGINMMLMSLVAMSIGFLISILVKSKNARSAAANTISLALSFISGIMVPAQYLGKEIKAVATFTPTYWNVRINDMLGETVEITNAILVNTFKYMGIQILFIMAIMGMALVAAKKAVSSEN